MPDATADDLEHLLEVQAHDTAIDRLERRRAELPERATLADVERRAAEVRSALAALDDEVAGVTTRERRLDDEVRSLAAKAAEVEQTLYGGTIRSPRELQALQADLEQLRGHQSRLEDAELDVMQEHEDLDTRRKILADDAATIAAEHAAVTARLTEGEVGIDAELGAERAARAALAALVPPGLLADYEQRRAKNRGIGIATLVGTQCQGCRLTIPAVEVDRFRHAPPGTICTPESCVCILVPR